MNRYIIGSLAFYFMKEIWLENRPNRNVASIDQMDEDGYEAGDNGEFVNELENEIDIDLFIAKLTPQQQKIARMLLDGYKQVEIAQKLNITPQAVNDVVKRARKHLDF